MVRKRSNHRGKPGETITLEYSFHIKKGRNGYQHIRPGEAKPVVEVPPGTIPRITRLMALAIRFEKLVREGAVKNYADLARLGRVTRARITQIMNLLNLAPDIQVALLNLPRTESGRDPITERTMRPIAAEPLWTRQRRMWRKIQP